MQNCCIKYAKVDHYTSSNSHELALFLLVVKITTSAFSIKFSLCLLTVFYKFRKSRSLLPPHHNLATDLVPHLSLWDIVPFSIKTIIGFLVLYASGSWEFHGQLKAVALFLQVFALSDLVILKMLKQSCSCNHIDMTWQKEDVRNQYFAPWFHWLKSELKSKWNLPMAMRP